MVHHQRKPRGTHYRTNSTRQRPTNRGVLFTEMTREQLLARRVAAVVLGDNRPDVWVSDRYAGQQNLARAHQVCLAHVLPDVQYAIDCGETIFAPKVRDHLRWSIGVGWRHRPKDTTLASYAAKADLKLSRLMRTPVAYPRGKALLKQIKA